MKLGDYASEIKRLREQKAELNAKLSDVEKKLLSLEKDLLDLLLEHGIEKIAAAGISISVKREAYPAVKDWDAFYDYVYNNKSGYLLQKRITLSAARELHDMGEDIPGVVWTDDVKLSYK